MTAVAERPTPRETVTPVNTEAFAYFRKLIEAAPEGFFSVLVQTNEGAKRVVAHTSTFSRSEGKKSVNHDGNWDSNDINQVWIVIKVCNPDVNPKEVAISEMSADMDAIIAFRPFERTGEHGSMNVRGRGKQTLELPIVGTVTGDQHAPDMIRDYPYTMAELGVHTKDEAERIGNTLMSLVKKPLER